MSELRFKPEYRKSSLSESLVELFTAILREVAAGRGVCEGYKFNSINKKKNKPPVIPKRKGVGGGKRPAWDIDLFVDFIWKEASDRDTEFKGLCNFPTIELTKALNDRRLTAKRAEIAFCAAAQSGGRYELDQFIAEYIRYCASECKINGQATRIRGIIGHEATVSQLLGEGDSIRPVTSPFIDPARQLLLRRTFERNDVAKAGEINLDPYDHHSIELIGREQQIEELNALLAHEKKFLILPIIGPSGAGKTRLITQWMSQHVSQAWHAGILEEPSDASEHYWDFQRDTLIVIDYVFRFSQAIKLIARKAREHRQHRIRLVLIDHVLPSLSAISSESFIAEALASDEHARADIQSHLLPEIRLSEAKNRLDILRTIIATTSGYEESSQQVSEGMKLLIAHEVVDPSFGLRAATTFSAVAQPLFAILVGQAIANGVPVAQWKRKDVISYYLNNERRLPWKHKPANELHGEWVGAFVAAATIKGGARFRKLFSFLPSSLNASDCARIGRHCNRIVSSSDGVRLLPFKPDILGESFFLMFFREFERVQEVRETFMQLVFSEDASDLQGKVVNHPESEFFLQFSLRITRNLFAAGLGQVDNEDDWQTLLGFLCADMLPCFDVRRLVIFQAILVVVGELKSIGRVDLCVDLLSHIVVDDLIHWSSSRRLAKQSFCIFLYLYENLNLLGAKLEGADKGVLAEVSRLFDAHDFGFNALHVAVNGRCYSAFDVLVSEDNIESRTKKHGLTPFMIAAKNGDIKALSLLYEHGADVKAANSMGAIPYILAPHADALGIIDWLDSIGSTIRVYSNEINL